MGDYAAPSHIAMSEYSELQLERLNYVSPVPASAERPELLVAVKGETTVARSGHDAAALRTWFPKTYPQAIVNLVRGGDNGDVAQKPNSSPLRVGIVFCGRQCPGANNVVAGLFDYLKAGNANNELIGFVGGTRGLFDKKSIVLTREVLAPFRNQGGFHLLGRSVDKIRTEADQAAALAAADALQLDGLVLLGGTFTNTDAAHLAEYFAQHQSGKRATAVVGIPATIDGDVCNVFVEATLGFDTATKVYAQLVGNMATDGNSAKKYYYYVRLMGRAASHITLEVALQTHPNITLLGEDIEGAL